MSFYDENTLTYDQDFPFGLTLSSFELDKSKLIY